MPGRRGRVWITGSLFGGAFLTVVLKMRGDVIRLVPARKERCVTEGNIRRTSSEQSRRMTEPGELCRNPDAPEGPHLPESCWESAVLVYPQRSKSVHLRIDPQVYDWFVRTSGGKGHLTRMQVVLRAHVPAHERDIPTGAE